MKVVLNVANLLRSLCQCQEKQKAKIIFERTSREKANDLFMKLSRVVWLSVNLREESLRIWTRYKE